MCSCFTPGADLHYWTHTQRELVKNRVRGLWLNTRLFNMIGYIKYKTKIFYNYMGYRILKNAHTKKVIRIVSVRRSGQHAIINWLQGQLSGSVCFYNNVRSDRGIFTSSDNKETRLRLNLKKFTLIYNVENSPIPPAKNRGVGKHEKWVDVLILRDPLNCFASYLNANWPWDKRFKESKEHRKSIVTLWKSHAREFLCETNQLTNKVLINYNEWVSNENYRKGIAEELGLDFTDKGISETPRYGLGSSFNNRSESNNKTGEPSKYLVRWKRYEDDPRFLELFTDNELASLCATIFPESKKHIEQLGVNLPIK